MVADHQGSQHQGGVEAFTLTDAAKSRSGVLYPRDCRVEIVMLALVVVPSRRMVGARSETVLSLLGEPLFNRGLRALHLDRLNTDIARSHVSAHGGLHFDDEAGGVQVMNQSINDLRQVLRWAINRFVRLQLNGIRELIEDPRRNPAPSGAAFWSRVLRLQFVL